MNETRVVLILILSVLSSGIAVAPHIYPHPGFTQLIPLRGEGIGRLTTATEGVWVISDVILPTTDTVEVREQGEYLGLLHDTRIGSRLADGSWYRASCSFDLVQSEYIFASFVDVFNWTVVNATLRDEGRHFPSFDAFREDVQGAPDWWLEFAWGYCVTCKS